MAETIRTIEGLPESWPEVPAGILIPIKGGAGDLSWVWQRIEAWCSERWTPREVVWLVQGDGEWLPPLVPVTITKVERWSGAWSEIEPDASAWGGLSLRGDAHRVTAIVGTDNPAPPAVIKAEGRLTNYLMQTYDPNDPDLWATSMRWIVAAGEDPAFGQQTQESYSRPADYIAKALQYSGAADLLRPYRRAR